MIPKRIFQTWKSKTEFPANFAHWAQTFRQHNPAYEFVLHDDADNRAFIQKHYEWFLPVYDAFPAEIYRVDAVRYFWLYHFGGFYADMDTECLRPLDPILERGGVVLGRMGTDPTFEHSIPNAIMASEPHQEFWLLVISLMLDQDTSQRPEYVTGPVLLKRAYDLYQRQDSEIIARIHRINCMMAFHPAGRSTVAVLNGHLLYPMDWSDRVHEILRRQLLTRNEVLSPEDARSFFPKSYTVTYWSHTWEPQNLV